MRSETPLAAAKRATDPGAVETTRATAHLPGLDITILHRHSPDEGTEEISINLRALPSFAAFGRSMGPCIHWRSGWRPAGWLGRRGWQQRTCCWALATPRC